jgi:hypothetical protein
MASYFYQTLKRLTAHAAHPDVLILAFVRGAAQLMFGSWQSSGLYVRMDRMFVTPSPTTWYKHAVHPHV